MARIKIKKVGNGKQKQEKEKTFNVTVKLPLKWKRALEFMAVDIRKMTLEELITEYARMWAELDVDDAIHRDLCCDRWCERF